MNELQLIESKFKTTKNKAETKHYLIHYYEYFKDIRHQPLKILEIGIQSGSSLLMWEEFFSKSKIYGLDITFDNIRPGYMNLIQKSDRIKIFKGSQTNVNRLETIKKATGKFDIIIDDGSHVSKHQEISFNYLFSNALSDNGMYIIEDLGSSYWTKYGGGYRKPGTMVEHLKSLVDTINYRFHRNRSRPRQRPPKRILRMNPLDDVLVSIHFYRGICFIKKGDNKSI